MVPDGITAAIVAALGILIAGMVLRARTRRRRRHELRAEADGAIAVLSSTPGRRGGDEGSRAAADDVAAQTVLAADALQELERLSRSEIAAAARDLRGQVVALGRTMEARLRGSGDPYILDVRATELRERVRGASQRLRAAVGD